VWQHWAGDAFLSGYQSVAGETPLPAGNACARLLRAFTLDKALDDSDPS
jgi:hypothetical protein